MDCCSGIWPVFKTLAHLDIVAAGLIATIGSMTGNGLQIVFGLLADRGWRKRLIVAGAAVAGAVTFAPWAVRSYPVMGALVLATNVGSAAFHPSATGAAASLSRRRVGFMIALFLSGGYLGYALSQFLFSAVHESAPGLTPVIALLPLAMAAAIAVGLPPRPRCAAMGVSSGGRCAATWALSRRSSPSRRSRAPSTSRSSSCCPTCWSRVTPRPGSSAAAATLR